MLSKTSGTSRGRRGSFFRDERCEFSFTATFLSFERETTLTADHIGHCRDSLLSNHSTIAGYVPPALERRGNPRDYGMPNVAKVHDVVRVSVPVNLRKIPWKACTR